MDLGALSGTTSRPLDNPSNGNIWLDTANSSWGIKEWSFSTQSFRNRTANVITSTSLITLQNGTKVTETVSKETETYYNYEINLNESKRRIKLLRSEIVSQSGLLDEFKRVINSKE